MISIADTEPFAERLRREHHVRDISDDQAFSGRVRLYLCVRPLSDPARPGTGYDVRSRARRLPQSVSEQLGQLRRLILPDYTNQP
jgi:hypothetical protein